MSKRGNGLKWPKCCFKCFQNMTKSSLPISSQVMKLGKDKIRVYIFYIYVYSISLHQPVRKVSNKIWAMKHSKRPIIGKHSLSVKKVLYAIFFYGEGVAVKVPVKMHHQKVLQRLSTEETEKVLSETTPYHWF